MPDVFSSSDADPVPSWVSPPAGWEASNGGLCVVLTAQGGQLSRDATGATLVQSACRFRRLERRLWRVDGSVLRPSGVTEPGEEAVWRIVDAGDGQVGLQTRPGTFVRAAPHLGPVSRDAPQIQAWERFMLMPVEDLDLIAACAASRWLVDDDPRPTAREEWRLAEGFRILVAGRRVAIADLVAALRTATAERSADGVPMSFGFFHGACTPSLALRYNPLIYATIGGADHFFEQVALCFSSIEAFGRYDGAYRLVCNRTRPEVEEFLGSIDPGRWDSVFYEIADIADIVRARRSILERAAFDGFQPILYLDSDIVCDRPIEPLLLAAARSERILISSEFPGVSIADLDSQHGNWFGAFLYGNDPRGAVHFCINNGVFAARNRQVCLSPLAAVAEAWARYRRHHPDAHRAAYDQPFYGYVLQCLEVADVATMDRWVRHLQGVEPSPAHEASGLAHFNIGVGLDKNRAMERYLGLLVDRHAQDRAQDRNERR